MVPHLERSPVKMAFDVAQCHSSGNAASHHEVHHVCGLGGDVVRVLCLHQLLRLLEELLLQEAGVVEEPLRVRAGRSRSKSVLQDRLQFVHSMLVTPAGASVQVAEGGRRAMLDDGEAKSVAIAVGSYRQELLVHAAGIPLPPESSP